MGDDQISKVWDAHLHVWGSPFPARSFNWTPDPFPVADLLEIFDRHGVDGGVHITPIMYGWDNSYGLASAAEHPARMRVFGRFDPLAPAPAERLRAWMANSGAAGVRLTFYGPGLRDLDDPVALEPFWAAAEDLGVRVAIFAPDALWTIVEVAERHPRLRLVIDHLGLGVYPGCENPLANYAALERFQPFPQILVKISGAIEVSKERYPFTDVQDLVRQAHATFGADRLMWGSNYPVMLSAGSYGEALAFVDECGFDDDERHAVLGATCLKMLAECEPGE